VEVEAAVVRRQASVDRMNLLIRFGNSAPQTVGIVAVLSSSLVGSLAGVGALVLFERRIANARRLWTVVAVSFLLVSLSLPMVASLNGSTKTSLTLMHLVTGVVLILALRRR
jgi:hypothetical protein